jgi:hypothetical protein
VGSSRSARLPCSARRTREGAVTTAAGIERVPRTVGLRDGLPVLEDQRVLDVATHSLGPLGSMRSRGRTPCTRSRSDLPVFGEEKKEPMHKRGVVANEPGLYFVGLVFLSAVSSALILGWRGTRSSSSRPSRPGPPRGQTRGWIGHV